MAKLSAILRRLSSVLKMLLFIIIMFWPTVLTYFFLAGEGRMWREGGGGVKLITTIRATCICLYAYIIIIITTTTIFVLLFKW